MQTVLLQAARPSGYAAQPLLVASPPHRVPLCNTYPLPHPLFCSSIKLLSYRFLSPAFFSSSSKLMHPSYASLSPPYAPNNGSERAKFAQVSKRLESTSRYLKRLGNIGFWGQLLCTMVAAVILSFSNVITGKSSSPATLYATSVGVVTAFVSVFWSFGYIRLSEQLHRTATEPSKAPARTDVVKSLKNGIVVNLLGMSAAILGMQATLAMLVTKALASPTNAYQGLSPGYSPVLALDVFLVQASASTILSHFLGLLCSLELLRSVALPPSESIPALKVA